MCSVRHGHGTMIIGKAKCNVHDETLFTAINFLKSLEAGHRYLNGNSVPEPHNTKEFQQTPEAH
ncbi:hypothetical protein BOTNAR_0129g00180 [Botryotinia narcissicola]|uniref:Uncharacterized protein n=1 Tax=Botryotinia narcissicola TaxID=278944 RepID=A0A4Z1IXV8_9HELO|nr:hypothetical protein BOTNAR_0129g00180 [Botryotinia narcissicola]